MRFSACLYVLPVLIIVIWTVGLSYDIYTRCETTFIQQTCENYLKRNSTSYNKFCETICVKKDFIIENCLFASTIQKSAFLVTIEGKNAVLKVDKLWFENMNNATRMFPNRTSVFDDYLQQIVYKYLGHNCTNCGKLISKLLSMADTDADGLVTSDEAIRFGSLLSSREIFMLAARNESNSAVTFYGYCGGMYFVERVTIARSKLIDTFATFTDLWRFPDILEELEEYLKKLLSSHPGILACHEAVYIFYMKLRGESGPTLEQRIDFVIGMVEFVYDLVSFDYGEIRSCDLHLANFGFSDLSNFSVVKQTDFDEVFAAAEVIHGAKEKQCNTDADCSGVYRDDVHHDECSSFCQDNGFCSKIMNHNLAYLCQTMFFDIFFNNITSALSDQELPKVAAQFILKILTECQRPVLEFSVNEHLLFIQGVANKFREIKQLIKTHSDSNILYFAN